MKKAYKTVVTNSGTLDGWKVSPCLDKGVGVIFVPEERVEEFETTFAGFLKSKHMWKAEENVSNLNDLLSPEKPDLPEALDSEFNLDQRRKLNKLSREDRESIKNYALGFIEPKAEDEDTEDEEVDDKKEDEVVTGEVEAVTDEETADEVTEDGEVEDEPVNFDEMTVAQLKELCEKERIEYNKSAKKDELIKLLKKEDNENS